MRARAGPTGRRAIEFCKLPCSNAAVGGEAAVDRDNRAGDELRSGGEQPQDCAKEVLWFSEAGHGGVGDDLIATLGQVSGVFVGEQEAVLIGKKESGSDGVDADFGEYSWAMCTASHWVKLLTAAFAPE